MVRLPCYRLFKFTSSFIKITSYIFQLYLSIYIYFVKIFTDKGYFHVINVVLVSIKKVAFLRKRMPLDI